MEKTVKEAVWRQFGASIDMLENAINLCPEELLSYLEYSRQKCYDFISKMRDETAKSRWNKRYVILHLSRE